MPLCASYVSCSLLATACVRMYRDAYVAWHTSIGKYGKYARRAIVAWRKIERWMAKHTPGIAKTLRYGIKC